MELLFESRREIVGRRGRLIPFQATATVEAEPVIEAERGDAAIYGTVLHEDGRFRMWYQSAPSRPDWDWSQDISDVRIAESDDGISWRKPKLGPEGNLTDLGLHSPAIVKQGGRYLATGCWKHSAGITAQATQPGYYITESRDGISWNLVKNVPCIPGGDVITSIWDERVGMGRTAYKLLRHHGGIQRRALFETTFTAEGWGTSRLALMPTEADDYTALSRGSRSADYYGMTLMPSGKTGLVGLVWMFYHRPPYFRSGSGMFGGSALVLAYKEHTDDAWVFSPGRIPFLEHPSRSSQDAFFYASSSVLDVGDEQRLYCTAFHRAHGWTLNEDRKREPEAIAQLQREGLSSIHLARWKRDRFFGFRAETKAELILYLGPITAPAKLLLNYRTTVEGWVRISAAKGPEDFITGFTPLPQSAEAGFSLEECLPLQGDACAGEVRWREQMVLPLTAPDQSLFITIQMFTAECYAYEVVYL